MVASSPSSTELPTGTLTFLFTDIEGSTRMLQELRDAYAPLLTEHRRILSEAAEKNDGRVFGSEGDALFVAFTDASSGLAAAVAAQRGLASHAWPEGHEVRVRMGLHTGEAQRLGDNYVGLALHQTARIMSAGHGGQILLSNTVKELASRALPDGISIMDLGLHRLKDLAEPERIYQVVDEQRPQTFPALKTLDLRPNNLPVQLTAFVGRDELDAAKRLLSGNTRLLTLTGPGGTGKTRLALQLAAEMTDTYTDGVYFVALDSVTDPELVASAIVGALGLDAGSQAPIDRLIAWGANRKVLLVLDNFEQVVDGAATVSRLLRELPDLRFIVTSRVPLHAYGEQEFPVPPLGLPTADRQGYADIARSEAVQLFALRAMAVKPSWALTPENAPDVAEIVRRLDGLPLAIELAAARIRVLTAAQIRSRLNERLTLLVGGARDLPTRQQTLRGAIDWSYDLLDEPDRRMFQRFGPFNGGATLSAAEDVCGPAADLGRDVFEAIDSLVDKSLVRSVASDGAADDEARFAMLATIREYALERLEASPDAKSVPHRHAEHYLSLAELAQPKLTGADGKLWLDRLEGDHDNLRAAIDWAVASGEAEIALRFGAALWRFWQIRGHLNEARMRLDRILAMPGATDAPTALRARAEGAAGSLAYWQADVNSTHVHYKAALDLARQTDDKRLLAESLYDFAYAPLPNLDLWGEAVPLGRPYMHEALQVYRELGDVRGQASVLWGLSTPMIIAGELDDAAKSLEEAEGLYRKLGDTFGIGWSEHMLSLIDGTRKNFADARRHSVEALKVFSETGDKSGVVLVIADFAVLAVYSGHERLAWRLAGATDHLRRMTGTDLVSNQLKGIDWDMPVAPAPTPELEAEWEAGLQLSMEESIALALADPDAGPDAMGTPAAPLEEVISPS